MADSQLGPVDPLAIVREALGHLQAAEGQSLPSDDQIIAGHVTTAIALLKLVAYPDTRQ